jgi:hypothetical protein
MTLAAVAPLASGVGRADNFSSPVVFNVLAAHSDQQALHTVLPGRVISAGQSRKSSFRMLEVGFSGVGDEEGDLGSGSNRAHNLLEWEILMV